MSCYQFINALSRCKDVIPCNNSKLVVDNKIAVRNFITKNPYLKYDDVVKMVMKNFQRISKQ